MRTIFIILSILIGYVEVQAADIEKLQNLFENNFQTFYEEKRCGKNIERFVRAAIESGIDLSGAEVVKIENSGGDTFGLVAAHQARYAEQSVEKPLGIDMNWYFHVVLLADGYVFDFDFRNQPTLLDLRSYLDQNFIPTKKKSDLEFRANKIGNYMLTFYSINQKGPVLSSPRKALISDFLKDFFQSVKNISPGRSCNSFMSLD
jgi:hypothetical protein